MDWIHNPVPNTWQWSAVFGTLLGAALALWAALSARSAKTQARLAKESAIRLGRVLQLSDLIDDAKELQHMLARNELQSVATKCAYLRGRVARFRTEVYNELDEDGIMCLDAVRDQLTVIAQEAVNPQPQLSERTRNSRIQTAFGNMNESLNQVFAKWRETAGA